MSDTYKVDYDDKDKAMGINGQYFFVFKRSDEIYYIMGHDYIGEEEYQIIMPGSPKDWRGLSYYTYFDFIRMHGFDPKTRKKVC